LPKFKAVHAASIWHYTTNLELVKLPDLNNFVQVAQTTAAILGIVTKAEQNMVSGRRKPTGKNRFILFKTDENRNGRVENRRLSAGNSQHMAADGGKAVRAVKMQCRQT
jgi:hypothetical protein